MLYVLRHGITDWNAQKKLQGQTDIPLNEDGRALAEKAHDEYKDVHFDVCWCSPLIRAKETADIVLRGRDIPIHYDDRLREISFGEYEGMDWIAPEHDHPINVFFNTPEKYTIRPEGGESLDDLFARTGSFLREIAYPLVEEGQDVLIVGHGAMNSSIICQVKNLPRSEFWSAGIENCKLKKLL